MLSDSLLGALILNHLYLVSMFIVVTTYMGQLQDLGKTIELVLSCNSQPVQSGALLDLTETLTHSFIEHI